MNEQLDLSKPFVKTYKEGKNFVLETNLPNDTIGDCAFEWDFDGSERKKWEEYLESLEKLGTKGDLVHRRTVWVYNPALDGEMEEKHKSLPTSSYEMKIIDDNLD